MQGGLSPEVVAFVVAALVANLGAIFGFVLTVWWKIAQLETRVGIAQRDVNNIGRLLRERSSQNQFHERKAS